MAHSEDTQTFLEALWGDIPAGLHMLIWNLKTKQSEWFAEVETAVNWTKGGNDLYVGVGLSPKDNGPKQRCVAGEVAGIAGLWADIDYKDGEAHKGDSLPPDYESAWRVLDSMGARPTLIVHSGHGLQAWWLLKEPLIFESPEDRRKAQMYSAEWQMSLAARAAEHGWKIDSVHDLARVLRVPGTFNCKTEPSVPVRLIRSDGPRYASLEDFDQYMVETSGEELAKMLGDKGVQVKAPGESRSSDYWKETINGVAQGERDVRITSLNGKLVGMATTESLESDSGREFLVQMALKVANGFDPPLTEHEVRRSFASICSAERRKRAYAETDKILQAELDKDASLGDMNAKDEQLAILGRLLSDPPLDVTRVVRMGKEQSVYLLYLRDGSMITMYDVFNQAFVRRAIFDQCNSIVRRVKQEVWESTVVYRLGKVVEVVEMPELEQRSRLIQMLCDHLGDSKPNPEDRWQVGVDEGHHFLREGCLYLGGRKVQDAVAAIGGKDGMKHRDISIYLREMGFTQVKVKVAGLPQRRYWRGNLSFIPSEVVDVVMPRTEE